MKISLYVPSKHSFFYGSGIYSSIFLYEVIVQSGSCDFASQALPFSACNIEKLGGAWGRGYTYPTLIRLALDIQRALSSSLHLQTSSGSTRKQHHPGQKKTTITSLIPAPLSFSMHMKEMRHSVISEVT